MKRRGRDWPDFKALLERMNADELREKLTKSIGQQQAIEAEPAAAEKAQQANVPDRRQARFDHEHDEGGGVTSRWTGNDDKRPAAREIGDAKEVSAATGDPIVLYGNQFAGVDGTIGNPPRLFQLKSAQDGPTLVRVITEARQNAQAHGDRGLEVHVWAPEMSLSQATDALLRDPVPYQSWLGRVVVHVRGGYFVVPTSGAPSA